MATTINSYSVGLSLNASDYIKNSSLSRKETAQLTREINAARNPQEKFNQQYDRLENALQKGAISLATYTRLLQSARDKLDAASTSATKAAKSVDSMNREMSESPMSRFKSELAGIAAGYMSISAAQRLVSATRSRMLEVDELAKSARAIGENTTQLQRFQFAVGEIAGIDGPAATTMLTKLTQRIGEASLGVGEAGENFKRLGLDVEKLKNMTPVQQFEQLAEAIRKVENPTEQVAHATKFFEESGAKLLPLLRATNEQYAESANQVDRLGASLSDIDVANIEAANDAINRVSTSVNGLLGNLAATGGLSQAIDALAGTVSFVGALEGLKNVKGVDDLTNKLFRLGIVSDEGFKEFQKLKDGVKEPVQDNKDIENIGAAIGSGISNLSDSVSKKSISIFGSIVDASKDFADKAVELDKWTEGKKSKLAEEAEKERSRIAREQFRERQNLQEKALDNARKAFDEEIDRQKKIQDAIASTAISSFEVGSAEASRFESEQFNRELSLQMPDAVEPSNETLVNEARKQYDLLVAANLETKAQTAALNALLEESKNNGFKRIR